MSDRRIKHPYWIYETIMGAPDVLSSWLEPDAESRIEETAERVLMREPRHIFFSGTGSSSLAAISQAFAFNEIAGIPASAHVTAELMHYPPAHFDSSSILALNTHSGKSPGDVEMVRRAKGRGVYTVGVTDIPDTPFARAVNALFIGNDGPKHEMPSTRTYSSAIFRVLLLAISCAMKKGSVDSSLEYDEKVKRIPRCMREFLINFESQAKKIAERLTRYRGYYVISAGPNMATATEGAMGLTQGTGKPAAGYNIDEYMHGQIQSLGSGLCVITVAPPGTYHEKIGRFTQCARRIGADVLMMAPEGSVFLDEHEMHVALPDAIPEVLTPALYCTPFWQIGYFCSLLNGLDPDTLSMDKQNFKDSGLAELKKLV
jgi:glucosamine 6-phosphate synthetase-like amidotransferase/phosphosugar isomerase protein